MKKKTCNFGIIPFILGMAIYYVLSNIVYPTIIEIQEPLATCRVSCESISAGKDNHYQLLYNDITGTPWDKNKDDCKKMCEAVSGMNCSNLWQIMSIDKPCRFK